MKTSIKYTFHNILCILFADFSHTQDGFHCSLFNTLLQKYKAWLQCAWQAKCGEKISSVKIKAKDYVLTLRKNGCHHREGETSSCLFIKVKPCWMRLITGWETIWEILITYTLGSQAGVVVIISDSNNNIITWCIFSFLIICWELTTWTANNCVKISVLLQIIFCSCVIETRLLCENGGSVPRAGREWFTWSKEQWSNTPNA